MRYQENDNNYEKLAMYFLFRMIENPLYYCPNNYTYKNS